MINYCFQFYILKENKFTTADATLVILSLFTFVENNTICELGVLSCSFYNVHLLNHASVFWDREREEEVQIKMSSKENPKVTRVNGKASDDNSNNLANEEAAYDNN